MEREEPLDPGPGYVGETSDAGATGRAGATGDVTAARDALRVLEQRLDRASETAERLIREAAAEALAPGAHSGRRPPASEPDGSPPRSTESRPPPAGWQVPEDDRRSARTRAASEIELLLDLVHSLRELIPPELQHRLAQAVREALLAVRALIDWYLEHLERRPAEVDEMQDIPIL
ncbi:MAG: hypothetical protein ACR2OB_03330 [Solirubrobacteraceae bacterium]